MNYLTDSSGRDFPLPPLLLAVAFLAALLFIAVWDVYAAFGAGNTQTVSAILYQWGREWPVLTLLVGLVIGHLFWPVFPK